MRIKPSCIGGPVPYKESDWVSHESKPVNSTPPRPLHQLLPPVSYPAGVPVLASLNDEQGWRNISQINPCLPYLPLVVVFYHNSNLLKTPCKMLDVRACNWNLSTWSQGQKDPWSSFTSQPSTRTHMCMCTTPPPTHTHFSPLSSLSPPPPKK